MNVVQETKPVKVTKYIAEDGTKFDTKESCMAYEYEKAFDGILNIECKCFDPDVVTDYSRVTRAAISVYSLGRSIWLRPKNEDEIMAISKFLLAVGDPFIIRKTDYAKALNKWIRIDGEFSGSLSNRRYKKNTYYTLTYLEDEIDRIREILSELGCRYEITIYED